MLPAPPAPRRANRITKLVLAVASAATVAGALSLAWTSFAPKLHAHRAKHELLRELQGAPSLRLHFTVKRDTMRVHGHAAFDAFANPSLGVDAITGAQTVAYNGVAIFADGATTHTYSLVDGVAYYGTQVDSVGAATEAVTCLGASLLPPLHEVIDAINGATHVDAMDGIDCAAGQLLQLRFAGDSFALCAHSRSGERGFDIYGSDLDIAVRYLSDAVTINAPAVSEAMLQSCDKVPDSAAVSPSTMNLLTGAGRDWVNTISSVGSSGDDDRASLQASTCACKGARRPCIFFHGVDEKVEGGLLDALDYWGDDIVNHAPCCSSIKFAQLNTFDFGWNNDALQQKVCDFSLSRSNTSDLASRTIEDTIIVAHSMGNLMLAGAIATGKCSLAKSSEWVALSGPLRGSIGSDFVQTICNGGNIGQDIIKAVVGLFGQCPAGVARKSLSYEGDQYCPPALQAQYDAAQLAYKSGVTAAACSTSYVGLLSSDQLTLILGGSVIPHKSKENDGVVEYQSCVADLPADRFVGKLDTRFYKSRVNHLDQAFRHGDALFSSAQKPVKWFECLL